MSNPSFTLFYHPVNLRKWDLSSYEIVLGNMRDEEYAVSVLRALNDGQLCNEMFFFMRDPIVPLWEDKKNVQGGCFCLKVANAHAPEVFRGLCLGLFTGEIGKTPDYLELMNGISISPKAGEFCIIKIWMSTTKYSSIRDILNEEMVDFLNRRAIKDKQNMIALFRSNLDQNM